MKGKIMSKELDALAMIEELAFYSSVTNTPKNNKILAQADKILRQALKRNEPMKLNRKRFKLGIYDEYRIDDYCPTCDGELTWGSNYCPDCGQKLDWSED